MRRIGVNLCSLTIALLLVCGAAPAGAQFRDGHESPQPTWRLAQADCGVRVLTQERTYRTSHGGNGSEALRLSLGRGTFLVNLLIVRAGFGGRTATCRKRGDPDDADGPMKGKRDNTADADFFRRLGDAFSVEADMAGPARLGRLGAGFVQANGPEPFVDADSVHRRLGCAPPRRRPSRW